MSNVDEETHEELIEFMMANEEERDRLQKRVVTLEADNKWLHQRRGELVIERDSAASRVAELEQGMRHIYKLAMSGLAVTTIIDGTVEIVCSAFNGNPDGK